MPLLSVVTPTHQPVPEFLSAAYESLRKQDLPVTWEWEWLIQEDGDDSLQRSPLPFCVEDERVRVASGRRSGVALTRNLALARSSGDVVKNLDSDDILGNGVLNRDVSVLAADPSVQWTTSRLLDLLPDGRTVGFDGDPPAGPIEPGYVFEYWRTHNFRLPVHPASLCIRRSLLLAMGGWMAIPGSEDSGLLLAASTIARGYFHADVGLWYRKWPGQLTANPDHSNKEELALRNKIMAERVQALEHSTPTYPEEPPPTSHDSTGSPSKSRNA